MTSKFWIFAQLLLECQLASTKKNVKTGRNTTICVAAGVILKLGIEINIRKKQGGDH